MGANGTVPNSNTEVEAGAHHAAKPSTISILSLASA